MLSNEIAVFPAMVPQNKVVVTVVAFQDIGPDGVQLARVEAALSITWSNIGGVGGHQES